MNSVLLARLALLLIAAAVALPSPLAMYWGARTEGDLLPVFAISCLFGGAILFAHRRLRGRQLWLDVVALTALLSVGGAAQNPFSMLYFVPITLASVVMVESTWRVALLSVLGYSLLLLQTTLALLPHRQHAEHGHFFHHVVGMAFALAVAGAFISFFVHRVGRSLGDKQRALLRLEREQREDRFAVSLGALSAGAAHELGTPLGTVQVLSEELPHLGGTELAQASARIVEQVARMKAILHGLASSELSAEVLRPGVSWGLDELLGPLRTDGALAQVRIDCRRGGRTTQPLSIVGQTVRELLQNARNADPAGPLVLAFDASDEGLTVTIEDRGPGLSAGELEQAMSPFFSGGGGRGLGLFLAMVHARQLGGSLVLESRQGYGTSAALRLPLHPPVGAELRRAPERGATE